MQRVEYRHRGDVCWRVAATCDDSDVARQVRNRLAARVTPLSSIAAVRIVIARPLTDLDEEIARS